MRLSVSALTTQFALKAAKNETITGSGIIREVIQYHVRDGERVGRERGEDDRREGGREGEKEEGGRERKRHMGDSVTSFKLKSGKEKRINPALKCGVSRG